MDLFWPKRGIVACDTHAPMLGSEEWQTQGWQQVPRWRQDINATVLQCQFCHGRPYVHHTRKSEAVDDDASNSAESCRRRARQVQDR